MSLPDRPCPLIGENIPGGACLDVSAHAFRLVDLTDDAFVTERLGERGLARDALAAVRDACPNLLWERS